VADILIKGGEMETAAQELAASIHEIFAVDPVRTAIAKQNPPNTRALVEIAAICLALPPAVIGTADIIARMHPGDRLQRLIAKAAALHKTTKSSILIDVGDGKPIPLEQAKHDTIVKALQELEQRLKA
jgi:hypothetical protein